MQEGYAVWYVSVRGTVLVQRCAYCTARAHGSRFQARFGSSWAPALRVYDLAASVIKYVQIHQGQMMPPGRRPIGNVICCSPEQSALEVEASLSVVMLTAHGVHAGLGSNTEPPVEKVPTGQAEQMVPP